MGDGRIGNGAESRHTALARRRSTTQRIAAASDAGRLPRPRARHSKPKRSAACAAMIPRRSTSRQNAAPAATSRYAGPAGCDEGAGWTRPHSHQPSMSPPVSTSASGLAMPMASRAASPKCIRSMSRLRAAARDRNRLVTGLLEGCARHRLSCAAGSAAVTAPPAWAYRRARRRLRRLRRGSVSLPRCALAERTGLPAISATRCRRRRSRPVCVGRRGEPTRATAATATATATAPAARPDRP